MRHYTKDGGGKAIKSAGSSLRRHNEAALETDVVATLTSWSSRLRAASLIFVAVGRRRLLTSG